MASLKALVRNELENGGRSLRTIVTPHGAAAAPGMDEDAVEAAVDRLPQTADMHINEVRLRVKLQIPNALEQHRARHHLPCAPHQKLKERKFLRGELDLAARAARAPPEQIELQIPDLQHRRRLRACLSAQERLDAREQLDERERLRQIVIAAGTQAAHAIIHITERREHEDRCLTALLTQDLHYRQSVHVRQHAIRDDGVILALGGAKQAIAAVRRMLYRVAALTQSLQHEACGFRVILD